MEPRSPSSPSVDYPTDTPSNASSGTARLLLGGVIAVLVLAAGAFALTQFTGAVEGGAGSPEEVILALFEALENEDAVGAADLLLPGERRALADPLFEALDELTRIGVFSDDLDAGSVGGVNIEVSDLVLRVDTVSADMANVHGSANLGATFDHTQIPVGTPLREALGDNPLEVTSEPEHETFDNMMITTVRENGRWYVSIFYTIAERSRIERGVAPLDAGQGVSPRGAPSPQAAVDQFLAALAPMSIRDLIASLNPDEAAALQRYAPLFLDDLEANPVVDAMTITGVEYRIDQRGDRATVHLDAFTLTMVDDTGYYGEETFTYRWGDGCYHVTTEYPDGAGHDDEHHGYMPPGWRYHEGVMIFCPDEVEQAPYGSPFMLGVLGIVDVGDSGLQLARHDGSWYVSPIATWTTGILDMLRAMESNSVDDLVSWLNPYGYEGRDDGREYLYDDYGDEYGTEVTETTIGR